MKEYFESEKKRMTNPKPIKQYVIPWIKGSPGPLKDESCDNTEKKFNINLITAFSKKVLWFFFNSSHTSTRLLNHFISPLLFSLIPKLAGIL